MIYIDLFVKSPRRNKKNQPQLKQITLLNAQYVCMVGYSSHSTNSIPNQCFVCLLIKNKLRRQRLFAPEEADDELKMHILEKSQLEGGKVF